MKRYQSQTHKLPHCELIDYSGDSPRGLVKLPALKVGKYRVIPDSVGGDAPKDFIRIYEHGKINRANSKSWPAFIAKVGHKWYPNESITEHFITRLGQKLGFRIADSALIMAHGQLRFLSRYFLRRKAGDTLIHGAEIFAGSLSRDSGRDETDFVAEVEEKDMARVIFTFQFVESSILSEFSNEADEILGDFVRLLAFDAIVGNNDRHYYNWGVIGDIRWERRPKLAPIYDTARALFWNTTDAKLDEKTRQNTQQREAFLQKYVKNSFPKTGWDGVEKPTHFDIIEKLSQIPEYKGVLATLCKLDPASTAREILNGTEFCELFTETRRDFMVDCLSIRFENFKKSVGC